jgi:quercetin dioxygenase-like cupin family protein
MMSKHGADDSRGKVQSLASCVEYQEGSIVSREILKKETGTLTVFAFDQGQGLSEHTAPFDAFVNVLDGEAEILIDGQSDIAKAGEFIILPANVPHALKAEVKFKMLLVMLRSQ